MDFIYSLLDELHPGSILPAATIAANDYVARYMEMRYFSFMTLTTICYGDIVPHSPAARTWAALEGVAGQDLPHGAGRASRRAAHRPRSHLEVARGLTQKRLRPADCTGSFFA